MIENRYPGRRRVRLALGYDVLPLQGMLMNTICEEV